MPPLEMGKPHVDRQEGPPGIPMSLDTKAFQKLPPRWHKKQQADFESLERGKQRSKKEGLWAKHQKRIPKAT